MPLDCAMASQAEPQGQHVTGLASVADQTQAASSSAIHCRAVTTPHPGPQPVRLAGSDDADAVARLLHDFNTEFGEPAPPPAELAERLAALLRAGDTFVVVGGSGPDAVAVVRCRPGLWSTGLECYLAELYVVPASRGVGLGRSVLRAAMDEARRRGADRMDLGTSETDVAARRLYEDMGFTNREGGSGGPVMYVYERDL